MHTGSLRSLFLLVSLLSLASLAACSSKEEAPLNPGAGGSWGEGGSGGLGDGAADGQGGGGGAGGTEDESCEGNSDCSAALPICDQQSKRCRAVCAAHSECPAERPECGEADCGACSSDEACEGRGEKAHCDPDSGACVPCLEDQHCLDASPLRPVCAEQTCVECSEDGHCSSGTCLPSGRCEEEPSCSAADPTCAFDRVCHEERGECLRPCNPERADSCDFGRVCEWLGSLPNGKAYGACVHLREGAGEQGASCSRPDDCQPNLSCLNSAEGALCSGYCEQGSETCPDNYECVGANRSGDLIFICAPKELPCELDSDCEEGRVCTPAANDARLLCLPKEGPIPAGGVCEEHANCQSGWCLSSGTCYEPCRTNSECSGGLCAPLTITFGRNAAGDPVQGQAPFCMEGCVADGDCPSGRVCAPMTDWEGDLAGGCHLLRVGDGEPGATCEEHAECALGICDGLPAPGESHQGMCLGACGSDGDCEEGAACAPLVFSDGTFSFCGGPTCSSEAECSAFRGYSCQTSLELVDGEAKRIGRCAPPTGPGGELETCASGSTGSGSLCRSGLCLGLPEHGWVCYSACEVAADCESGRCELIEPDEGYLLSACLPEGFEIPASWIPKP